MQNKILTILEWDKFHKSLNQATKETEIYYPNAFVEISLCKEFNIHLVDTNLWKDIPTHVELLLKYYTLMDNNLNKKIMDLSKNTTTTPSMNNLTRR